jgi:hypothetical protein
LLINNNKFYEINITLLEFVKAKKQQHFIVITSPHFVGMPFIFNINKVFFSSCKENSEIKQLLSHLLGTGNLVGHLSFLKPKQLSY